MKAQHRSSSLLEVACLAAILVVAAVLRLYALPRRGLLYWDEAKYALEGIRFETALHHLLGAHGPIVAGKAVGTAKPTHALLIALALLFGVHDYMALMVNVVASVAQIGLVYAIARYLFGRPVALVSALFLAVSEYDVIYARSGLSESDANFFLLAGVLAWLTLSGVRERGEPGWRTQPWLPIQSRSAPYGFRAAQSIADVPRSLILAGVILGVAFTTNYRLVVYIAAIVLFDLIWSWFVSSWRTAGARAVLWVVGLVAVPLLWQIVDITARANGLVLFRSDLNGQPRSYLSEVLYQLHEGKQSAIHFDPLPYVNWYVLRQGLPAFLLLVLGISFALRSRSFAWLAMTVPVVVPYTVYTFAPFIVPRNLDAALPFAAVLAASALVTIVTNLRSAGNESPRITAVHWKSSETALLLGATLVIAALGAQMSWRLTAERSGYARAAQYVERHGHGRALVSSEVMVFYLRGSGRQCHAPPLRHSMVRLSADVAAGYRYAVLDHFSWQLSRFVRNHMERVIQYSTVGPISIGENPIDSEHYPQSGRYRLRDVYVFRLDPARLPPPGKARPDVCDRDRV